MRRSPVSSVSAYWWIKQPNFGDRLTPLLLDRFAGLTAHWDVPAEARLVVVGSVLHHLPRDYSGYVLGAGKIRESDQRLEDAHVLALRGPLTAKGVKGDYVLGDPGLLADELVQVDAKLYSTGILPHWSDTELVKRREFHDADSIVIDPGWDPLKVIRTIGECRRIVTSSLHAVILADAFGIRRRLIYTPMMDRDGGIFKFLDYSASIGLSMQVGMFQLANRDRINDIKSELYDAFEAFGDEMRRR